MKILSTINIGLLAISVTLGSAATSYAQTTPNAINLPNRTWEMIVFPGVRGNRTTVAQYMSATSELDPANLAPAGASNWGLFEYDDSNQKYIQLAATDVLKPGVGYWIAQLTGSDVTINPPIGAFIAGLPYSLCNDNISNGNDMTAEGGDLCQYVHLSGDTAELPEWRMSGNPGVSPINFQDIAFRGGLSSENGAPFMGDVGAFFNRAIWGWDSDASTFVGFHLNPSTPIPQGSAFWIDTGSLPDHPSKSYALLLPTLETKRALAGQCPLECTNPTGTPPPAPPGDLPASRVDVVAERGSNDISRVAQINVGMRVAFTFTAGTTERNPMCEINSLTIVTGDNASATEAGPLNAEIEPFQLNDVQFAACVQQVFSNIDVPPPSTNN